MNSEKPFSDVEIERFEAKFHKSGEDECWEWTASLIGGGYGQIGNRPSYRYAHRFSYRLYVGPIPKGMCVLHHCDNRKCVNPNHLFLGTNKDNVDDKVSKGRQRGAKGECSGRAKLTDQDVLAIRKRYRRPSHNESNAGQLAKEFGMSVVQIQIIVGGRQWKHLL